MKPKEPDVTVDVTPWVKTKVCPCLKIAPPIVVADVDPHVNFIASHRIPPLKEWQIIRNPTIFNIIRWVDGSQKDHPNV